MARDVRRPERRQAVLLPPDRQDWRPQDDIAHLVLNAVSPIDRALCGKARQLGSGLTD
jgi:hypothetical protein